MGPGGSEYGRSTWTHFYAQDDWRIHRSLMFNFGVRYEINGKITDTQNRLSSIETDRFVIASDDEGRVNAFAGGLPGLIPGTYVTFKAAGYDRSLQRPNYRHIAPRAGLAWELSDKTVIRAGWGLFFNQAAYSIQTALTENLPFFFNKSVNTAATTLIPSRTRIQFRAEIFNLFNRTNFADVPGRIAFTPAFGRYSSALNSRQAQLALKLLF